jgi:DNA-binding SARP family transcriptional activator/streptogramin lyase
VRGCTVAWLGGLRYLILGPLEIHDGAAEVALRGGQQRKLLAILLLHGSEVVSSDRLIDELWAGKPPGTAAKALQGYVSSLRKQLGPETIETVGAGYRLKLAADQVDVHEFEELLAEARPLERGPAATKLQEALALWRGPALADFAYDDFAQREIERLEELRQAGIERRINLELALGHHDDLVPELEALVRAHPLHERLRGHLMVALYRSGRQAEALDVYADGRTVLLDELGLEPSEELQALQRAILAHDPSLAAPPRVDTPKAAGTGRPPDRRLRRPLVLAAVGLAILAGAATAVVLTQREDAAIVVPPNSVARIDGSGNKLESYVGVGKDPVALAVGVGGVWVANANDGTVSRLDPTTGTFERNIAIGDDDLSDIAVGFGSVWVADGNGGTVTRIDPNLNGIQATIAPAGRPTLAPSGVYFVAVGSGYVWATRGDQLLRIDPKTNRVDKRLSVDTPTGLTTGGGSVWVTTQSEQVWHIDPRTVKRTDFLTLSDAISEPVYEGGSLWISYQGEIEEIDPVTFGTGAVLRVAGGPISLAAGEGALWAVDTRGYLSRFTPDESTAATGSLRVGRHTTDVAVGRGAVWIAVSANG